MLFLNLTGIFFKLGLLTIGGGYAMLPLIQREIIQYGWITPQEFVDIVAIAEMTPGPIAINAATFVGYRLAGVFGALVTTTAISLPSLLIILAISRFMQHFEEHPVVKSIFFGVRPAVAGLVTSAALYIVRTALIGVQAPQASLRDMLLAVNPFLLLISLITFIILNKTKIHPILSICIAGGLGILLL
jgi:chromate transporter